MLCENGTQCTLWWWGRAFTSQSRGPKFDSWEYVSTFVEFSLVKFNHIYFTSIEKQILTPYTNLSRFCFLGTTPVLVPNVWAIEKSQC